MKEKSIRGAGVHTIALINKYLKLDPILRDDRQEFYFYKDESLNHAELDKWSMFYLSKSVS